MFGYIRPIHRISQTLSPKIFLVQARIGEFSGTQIIVESDLSIAYMIVGYFEDAVL